MIVTAFMVSCSDWTQYENLIYHKTPAQQNPEAYSEYLGSIRLYKQKEHRLMFVTMTGTSKYPSCQNQHLMSLPDSADFIIIKNMDNLHVSLVGEIKEVLEKKGTKSLGYVDYSIITEEWNIIQDKRLEAGGPEPTLDELRNFYSLRSKEQLTLCDRYGFHGIVASYIGNANNERDKAGQDGFVASVKEWIEANPDKTVALRGSIRNIDDISISRSADYHIVLCGSETSRVQMNSKVKRILGTEVEQDKVVLEVSLPSAENPDQTGYTPAKAASEWLLPALGLDDTGAPSSNPSHKQEFTPLGLCVENVQDDYYNTNRIYHETRKGITALVN